MAKQTDEELARELQAMFDAEVAGSVLAEDEALAKRIQVRSYCRPIQIQSSCLVRTFASSRLHAKSCPPVVRHTPNQPVPPTLRWVPRLPGCPWHGYARVLYRYNAQIPLLIMISGFGERQEEMELQDEFAQANQRRADERTNERVSIPPSILMLGSQHRKYTYICKCLQNAVLRLTV